MGRRCHEMAIILFCNGIYIYVYFYGYMSFFCANMPGYVMDVHVSRK